MSKFLIFVFIFSTIVVVNAQEVSLPVDFRQHNLVEYNSSLFNPAFSLDQNYPQSIALWTRWQWQSIDADPTTLFLNYTRKLNEASTVGAAFFQHNTGVFFNTGGIINYARSINLSPTIKLAIGANLFGFNQQLADERFQIDPEIPFPELQPSNDFILQLAPGVRLSVENFSFSLASENLIDYNFNDKGRNTVPADKIFLGMVSYDFPVGMKSDSTAFLRPRMYLRTIPEMDNQIGLDALFSTGKYWAQLGYNNFYGISFGGGGTFFKRASLGALVEFGASSNLNDMDPSFEIVLGYFLGKPEQRRKIHGFDHLEEEELLAEPSRDDAIKKELEKAEALARENEAEEREVEKRLKKEAKDLAIIEKARRKDSLDAIKKQQKAIVAAQKQEELEAEEMAKKRNEALAKDEKEAEEQRLAEAERRATESAKEEEALAAKKEEEEQLAELEKRRNDSIARSNEQKALAEDQRLAEQRKKDSIETQRLAEAETAKKEQEELAGQNEAVKPQAGEKYEEVKTEDGLAPGYYLIANVFGTQKYFDAFVADLKGKGLQPKSFLRSKNSFHYVYLEKYATMGEARQARDSNFEGRYPEKTWIFRVRGE